APGISCRDRQSEALAAPDGDEMPGQIRACVMRPRQPTHPRDPLMASFVEDCGLAKRGLERQRIGNEILPPRSALKVEGPDVNGSAAGQEQAAGLQHPVTVRIEPDRRAEARRGT